ncbi:MAG: SMP-30/gluconolactonase/LRE family protein [Flavobacteriales bacterium]|nr:SMP-30/gluconolactonase/LRE family protein [Flavobacteriales bacterium]
MKKLLVILGTILCGGMYAQSVDLLPEGTFTAAMEASSHDAAGNLYAVGLDVPHKGNVAVVRDGKVSLYLTLPEGSVGNGIVWDKDGNMYIADYTAHNVWIKRRGKENLELYAHRSDMSQPNDLAIHPAGYIYASDPAWNKGTGRLWLVKEGEITLLEDNMGTTNGIEVSPAGRCLYVNESVQRRIWKYMIHKDGTLGTKKMFFAFPDYGMDGMRCDSAGRLWVTRHGKGTVVILSPSGKMMKEITLRGKNCTNITLIEDDDYIYGYVTVADRGCFEKIQVSKKELRTVSSVIGIGR